MYEKKEDNKQQTILGNQSIFLKEVASSDVVSKFESYIHRNETVHFNSNFNKKHTPIYSQMKYQESFAKTHENDNILYIN